MKKHMSILFIFASTFSTCGCQSHCDIKGYWLLKSGRIFENYEQSSPYSYNRISFSNDSVELTSGFFYLTEDLINNSPVGRYPFVYYGNKEKYKTSGDSLYIYSKPYKSWNSFKMNCISKDELQLIGEREILLLTKTKPIEARDCAITYIKAHIFGGSLDIFKINYRVTYSNDDKLIFEEWDPQSKNFIAQEFKLRQGTFKDICLGFSGVDVSNLKSLYPTQISEINTTKIEIGLSNGKVVKSELQNEDYPEELRFALIRVLYTHQQLFYSHLPAVK